MAIAVVAGVALLAIAPLTEGRTASPVPAWIGVVVGLALVARILTERAVRPWVDLLLSVAIGLAAASAHLGGGLVFGHDTPHHAWGAFAWREAWRAGDLLPIWLHHLGLGLPLPLFYGPLSFLVMAPFALVGAGIGTMVSASFVLASVVAALVARRAVVEWTADGRAGLVAAAAWAFAPYRLLDANFRVALGETWALALLPWVLFAFHRLLARPDGRSARAAALATALLAFAHPLSLVLTGLVLPILWMGTTPPWHSGARPSVGAALRALGAGLFGLALAGVFALPLFVESRFTSLGNVMAPEGTLLYAGHGLGLAQLFERRLWARLWWSLSAEQSAGGAVEMPYYVGVTLVAALAVAAVVATRRRRGGSALGALGLLGLASLAFACAPVAGWMAFFPFTSLQFPWRFLGPASAAGALALGLLAARAGGSRRARALVAALALAPLVDGFPHAGAVVKTRLLDGPAAYTTKPGRGFVLTAIDAPWPLRVSGKFLPPDHPSARTGWTGAYNDYLTPAAWANDDLRSRSVGRMTGKRDAIERVEGTYPYARLLRGARRLPLEFTRGSGSIEVRTAGRPGRLQVAEQAFPGWQVEIAGRWRDVVADDEGWLSATVPAGVERVRFRFDRWRWDRTLGWVVSLAAWLGFGAWRRRERTLA